MNIIEMAREAEEFAAQNAVYINKTYSGSEVRDFEYYELLYRKFAELVAAAARADELDAIMRSIEELRPVENNPLLQNKPAAFWIENFRQIVYARGTT